MKKILVLVCLFMPMFSNAICLGIFEDKDECKTRELLEELRKEEENKAEGGVIGLKDRAVKMHRNVV